MSSSRPLTTGPPYRRGPDGETGCCALCELFALVIYQLEGRPLPVGVAVHRSRVGRGDELQAGGKRRCPPVEPLLEEIADLLRAPPLLGPVPLELRRDRDELVFS